MRVALNHCSPLLILCVFFGAGVELCVFFPSTPDGNAVYKHHFVLLVIHCEEEARRRNRGH
jgi:hypothetical protein